MHQALRAASPKAVVLLLAATLSACATTSVPPVGESSQSFEREFTKTVNAEYLLFLPSDYHDSGKDYPLVLFLHGAGERGDNLDKVGIHGPPQQAREGRDFPFILVAPQCPEDEWWNTDTLIALLDEVEKRYRVDPDRIYVTGLSMGGYATWGLAVQQPHRFAAVLPICGGGSPSKAEVIKHLPVWVFHGDADEVVHIDESRKMVDALEAAGGNVKFTVYPGVGHDSWTRTYNNPDVYEWLLSHRRTRQK